MKKSTLALLYFVLKLLSCNPETVVEYRDRDVEVPRPRPVPCVDGDCDHKTKLSRAAIVANLRFICNDENCRTETAHSHVNFTEVMYDNTIWSSWIGREGAFHESLDTTDPLFTTIVDGVEVFPCINDTDRQRAEAAARLLTVGLHPDPNCDSTENCHAKTRVIVDSIYHEALERYDDANCDHSKLGAIGTANAYFRALRDSWLEREGLYHEACNLPSNVTIGSVQLPGTSTAVFPCYNNADRRAARAAADAAMDILTP